MSDFRQTEGAKYYVHIQINYWNDNYLPQIEETIIRMNQTHPGAFNYGIYKQQIEADFFEITFYKYVDSTDINKGVSPNGVLLHQTENNITDYPAFLEKLQQAIA